jgi:threonine dehydrogenase-like Zn-dependent dehydrogenase
LREGGASKLPLIPFSDGAGEVIAVGDGVTRVAAGDRVCPMFFQSWLDGKVSATSWRLALGGTRPGVLQEIMLLDADGVSRTPSHMSFQEAATLPCAGLTAWRALFEEAKLQPGETVLVPGTGGVSIFALQFAKLAGAFVIVNSSSDEKLERAKALGADHTINYRSAPEWGKAAADWAGGVSTMSSRSVARTRLAVAGGSAGRRHDPGYRRALRLLAIDRDPERGPHALAPGSGWQVNGSWSPSSSSQNRLRWRQFARSSMRMRRCHASANRGTSFALRRARIHGRTIASCFGKSMIAARPSHLQSPHFAAFDKTSADWS